MSQDAALGGAQLPFSAMGKKQLYMRYMAAYTYANMLTATTKDLFTVLQGSAHR